MGTCTDPLTQRIQNSNIQHQRGHRLPSVAAQHVGAPVVADGGVTVLGCRGAIVGHSLAGVRHVARRLLAGKAKISPYPVLMMLPGCQEGQEDAADAVRSLRVARRLCSRPENNDFLHDGAARQVLMPAVRLQM